MNSLDTRDTSTMETRKRRRCTPEFKIEAARLVLDEHKPVASVARYLGLWESALTRWVKQEKVDSGHGQSGELKTG